MKKFTESVQLKMICVGMVCLLVATLMPLFIIAHYNFISVDDFTFAASSGRIWEETRSVWSVLAELFGFSDFGEVPGSGQASRRHRVH